MFKQRNISGNILSLNLFSDGKRRHYLDVSSFHGLELFKDIPSCFSAATPTLMQCDKGPRLNRPKSRKILLDLI